MIDMIEVDNLLNKLETLEPGSAIALKFDIESYFDVITTITDDFIKGKDMRVIYETSTIPANSILELLNAMEISMDPINFVDAVSYMTMGAAGKSVGVTFVESPTMLENIMLKIEYLLKKNPSESNTVVLDSINSLAIHNDNKILAEFLHILISSLRSSDCYTIILSVAEQESEDIDNILAMVCDDIIEVSS
ncbi:MAG: hypothetical protein ACQEQM_08520 [Thermoplasmatota archaeon]